VAELLTLLGNGKIEQRGAQAAAWHLANGMSWEQLEHKRIQTVVGDGGSYFTPEQIASGVTVAQVVVSIAESRPIAKTGDAKSTPDTKESGDVASPGDGKAPIDSTSPDRGSTRSRRTPAR
jgi:hypothetical protein